MALYDVATNIKNGITGSIRNRQTNRNVDKKVDKILSSDLHYNKKTGKIERYSTATSSLDEKERKQKIKNLKKELEEKCRDTRIMNNARPGKDVSFKQQSKYVSNYAAVHRQNIQEIISELKDLGCKVIPKENGYHVTESVSKKEYTNEDIKDMKLKIYEAYHDGRILSSDKDELFMLLEKAIENYNEESMD